MVHLLNFWLVAQSCKFNSDYGAGYPNQMFMPYFIVFSKFLCSQLLLIICVLAGLSFVVASDRGSTNRMESHHAYALCLTSSADGCLSTFPNSKFVSMDQKPFLSSDVFR